jgi:hypothetical protein
MLVMLIMAALAVLLRPPAPIAAEAAPMQGVAAAPQDVRQAWAVDLLARLGNEKPSADTVAFVVAWTVAEDSCMQDCGYSSAWERFNPLNTTQEGYGAYATINGDGVKAYPDYESGIAATVQTLSYGYYTELVAGLQANDPERALRGLYASPWGTNAVHVEQLWRAQ